MAHTNMVVLRAFLAVQPLRIRYHGIQPPIMPSKMETLLKYLGHDLDITNDYEKEMRENKWAGKFNLSSVLEPLFTRPEKTLQEDVLK